MATKSPKFQINVPNPFDLSVRKAAAPIEAGVPDTESELGAIRMYRYQQETVPIWSDLEDLIAETKLMKKHLPAVRKSGLLEADNVQYAMMYVESFLEHSAPCEVFAIYELLKLHALLMRQKELGKRPS